MCPHWSYNREYAVVAVFEIVVAVVVVSIVVVTN